jgi:hypothetical protein
MLQVDTEVSKTWVPGCRLGPLKIFGGQHYPVEAGDLPENFRSLVVREQYNTEIIICTVVSGLLMEA